jgi:hypothetical protein
MKRNHIFSIVGLIIVALIVLIIVLPGKGKKEKNQPAEELTVFEAPKAFIGEGDMVYSFDGINWDLNLIEAGSARVPETRVGFYFENFTRRENAPAAVFGNPFHLGFYKGDCSVIDTLPQDNASIDMIEGTFISGIACVYQEEGSVVVLAQNGKTITAYDMSNLTPTVLNAVREIDITNIIE